MIIKHGRHIFWGEFTRRAKVSGLSFLYYTFWMLFGTWIFPGCGVIKHEKFYTQLSTWLVVCIIHMYLELTHSDTLCGNCFSQSLTLLLFSTVHQVFKDLDFLGWYTTGGPPTMNDISVHKQVCDQENPKPQQPIKYKLLLSIYSQLQCTCMCGTVWRNWQVISCWRQSLSNYQFSQHCSYIFLGQVWRIKVRIFGT